jgi:hypothetical protein
MLQSDRYVKELETAKTCLEAIVNVFEAVGR